MSIIDTVRSRSFSFVLVRSRSLSIIDQKGINMKAIIENLYYKEHDEESYSVAFTLLYNSPAHTKPAVRALLDRDEFVEELAKTGELMDISITCNGIIVRDDLITVEFPDGLVADYEIVSDDFSRITII